MSIVRVVKKIVGYTTMSNQGLNDPNLSCKATGLWAFLMGKPDYYKVRINDLVNSKKDKKPAIQSALKELEKHGYARLATIYVDGKARGKEWVIYETPDLLVADLSDSRQQENLVVRKEQTTRFSDDQENRRSEKQTVRKPGHIVSTNTVPNTNTLLSTSTVQYTQKSKNEKKGGAAPLVEQLPPTPQVPAPPPPPAKGAELTTFCESALFQAGPEWFRAKALESGVPDTVDTAHYFNRMKTWGQNKATLPKASNWLETGIRWIKEDGAKAKQIKTNINNASNNTSNNGNSASKNGNGSRPRSSAADIAAGVGGILDRLGRKGRL